MLRFPLSDQSWLGSPSCGISPFCWSFLRLIERLCCQSCVIVCAVCVGSCSSCALEDVARLFHFNTRPWVAVVWGSAILYYLHMLCCLKNGYTSSYRRFRCIARHLEMDIRWLSGPLYCRVWLQLAVVLCLNSQFPVSSVLVLFTTGSIIVLYAEKILCGPFSFTAMESVVSDMILKGWTVFDTNFVNRAFVIRVDSVICTGYLSVNMCCLKGSYRVLWTVLWKSRLWGALAVASWALFLYRGDPFSGGT